MLAFRSAMWTLLLLAGYLGPSLFFLALGQLNSAIYAIGGTSAFVLVLGLWALIYEAIKDYRA